MTDVRAAHGQAAYGVRLEWGPTGGAAVAEGADLAVVVDVLSFTTTLGIAVARGTRVHPFPWNDQRAAAFAAERDAVLAVGRPEAARLAHPPPSLSPAAMLASEPVPRLVLPSPNGSTICAALAAAPAPPGSTGVTVVGASLRTRAAVTRWLVPRLAGGATVAVVPAGERWPDGSLRPSLEDLWGAGAVVDALLRGGAPLRPSPEAEHAAASYRRVADRLPEVLAACAGGRELAARGYAEDVAVAAAVDADEVVPVLTDEGFVAGQEPALGGPPGGG